MRKIILSLMLLMIGLFHAQAERIAVAPFEVPAGQDDQLAMFVCETFADLLEEEGIEVVRPDQTMRAFSIVRQQHPDWNDSKIRDVVISKLELSRLYEGSLRKMGTKYYTALKPFGSDGKADKVLRVKRASEAGLETMAEELVCAIYGREPPEQQVAQTQTSGTAATEHVANVDSSINGTFITLPWRCPMSHVRGEYQGVVVQGYPHGFGKIVFVNGEKYTGSFVKGYMHGRGRYEFTNGQVYEGDMAASLIHGTGTMSYVSGEAYTGNFEAGTRSGPGLLRLKNGGSLEGLWIEDALQGRVLYTAANGYKEVRLFRDSEDVTPQPEQQSSSGGGVLGYLGGMGVAGVSFAGHALGGGIAGGMLSQKAPGLMEAYGKYEEAMAPIEKLKTVKGILDDLSGASAEELGSPPPPPPPDDPFSGGMQ
ncbi:MAG: hypothetical protein KJ626_15510 [Verrucomicrobia bacterium]|nr:hypothetical protein [Verrucomicrobiota bacterium]